MTPSGIFLTFILLYYIHFTPSFCQWHLYIHLSFNLWGLPWDQSPLFFVRLLTFTILARSLRGLFLPPCSLRQLCLFFILLLSSAPIPSAHVLSRFCVVFPVVIVSLRCRPLLSICGPSTTSLLPLLFVSLSCRRVVIESLCSCLHMIYVLWSGICLPACQPQKVTVVLLVPCSILFGSVPHHLGQYP